MLSSSALGYALNHGPYCFCHGSASGSDAGEGLQPDNPVSDDNDAQRRLSFDNSKMVCWADMANWKKVGSGAP